LNIGIPEEVMFYSDTTILFIGIFLGAFIVIILYIWIYVQSSNILKQSMSQSQDAGFVNQRHPEISHQPSDIILGRSNNLPYMNSQGPGNDLITNEFQNSNNHYTNKGRRQQKNPRLKQRRLGIEGEKAYGKKNGEYWGTITGSSGNHWSLDTGRFLRKGQQDRTWEILSSR